MKSINRVLIFLLILSLVFILMKPESISLSNQQLKYNPISSPCSSRLIVSACSVSVDYALNEALIGLKALSLLFIGLMQFLLIQRSYSFLNSTIFKPPIFTNAF
ncbi:hypothetical protein [Legionella sp. km772]|uniref:hypothetical protein n=1 Tax=Legionella sp. km772 TaxID=2498111 RepID=UPI000F8D94A2|nr:hypothetical protein [Legionella sp. km772]RUR05250.1 hypothetical protein ELY15_14545 [Legionella sp. km772]